MYVLPRVIRSLQDSFGCYLNLCIPCLPECLSCCLPACLPVCLSVCLSMCPSVCQLNYLSVCLCPRRSSVISCVQGANEKLEKALMAAHSHAPPMHASTPPESAGQGLRACCKAASDHWPWLQQHSACQCNHSQCRKLASKSNCAHCLCCI